MEIMTIEFNIATDTTQAGVLQDGESDYREPEDILRLFCSALTGLDKTLVRKRWLTKPGTTPALGTDWCAIGVDRVETFGTPWQHGDKPMIQSDPDVITRTSHQTLHCVATFYGVNAAEIADIFRDGFQVQQNLAELKRYGLVFQGVDDEIRHVPDFMFEQWVDRYDVAFRVGRSITRTFGVRTFTSAKTIELITEKGIVK